MKKVEEFVPDYIKQNILPEVLNMDIDKLAEFDFLKFTNGDVSEEYLNIFRNICNNIYALDNVLKENNLKFKVSLQDYIKWVDNVRKNNKSNDHFNFIDDYHLEMYDLFYLTRKGLFIEKKDNRSFIK